MALGLTPAKARLHAARERASTALLAQRGPGGHWMGELSSSALSTATAIIALSLAERESPLRLARPVLRRGLDWLARQANADGGWGDTTLSFSNLSTTAVVWAAFGAAPGADEEYATVVSRAEARLANWVNLPGSALRASPGALASAVLRRYGGDRTFSVPILTACALAGRLGAGKPAWADVIPLPFELAALPHGCFAALRLPVVSYALPALIAIGQARHVHRPSLNPVSRLIRHLTRRRTLNVLEGIQPPNGGFLEATPLTSFVVMSLAGSGQAGHPVVHRGVDFLLQSQRTDGSWPIDTNLATWLTTLAINALASSDAPFDKTQLQAWLLGQQYRREHPYTHAAPGGWAWTDLPGGVPDADDTAGALLALRHLTHADPISTQAEAAAAAQAGIAWLLALQNRDGGIPTFCRGWGALPFDRSSADLTAHALRAWLAWYPGLSPDWQKRIRLAISRALAYLERTQREDGAWLPLWFGNQHAPGDENPVYGTSRVVRALAEARGSWPQVERPLQRAVAWLVQAQHAEGAWGGAAAASASVEETALALEALASALELWPDGELAGNSRVAVNRATDWLVQKVESGEWTQPAPIGFYFAKLWYYEKLYPQVFTVAALNQVAKLEKHPATLTAAPR